MGSTDYHDIDESLMESFQRAIWGLNDAHHQGRKMEFEVLDHFKSSIRLHVAIGVPRAYLAGRAA